MQDRTTTSSSRPVGRVRALLLAAAKERATQALTLKRSNEDQHSKDHHQQPQHQQEILFAPYSPSPMSVIDAVWTHLQQHEQPTLSSNELLVDLGCGDGRWLISGVHQFGCRALGIELDPALVHAARGRVVAAGLEQRIEIREDDIMKVPIQNARLVIVYAFAESLHGIREYLAQQLSANAMVLSIGFRVPDWKPRCSERVDGLRWYLYEMNAVYHKGTLSSCTPSDEQLSSMMTRVTEPGAA